MSELIRARDLVRRYHRTGSAPWRRDRVTALEGVSVAIGPAERVGIVGDSGAGKSTLLRVLLALEAPDAGTVCCQGRLVRPAGPRKLRWFRSAVQLVPQDPLSSLNPRLRVGHSIAEPLRGLGIGGDHRARVAELLHAVGLDEQAARRYPQEFSGGQRQRIAIARALAPRPRLVLADEPVSALDTVLRTQILDLLLRLSEEQGTGLVVVSHDIAAVRRICRRVVVLHQGRIVEEGKTAEVFASPRHPHTRALLDAVPRLPTP